MPALEVILLGTGSPLYNADRCGSGYIVIGGDVRVLVDCGWGASRRMNAAGVPQFMVHHACFTHMHSDHITDIPDFLMMRWTGGATAPLKVYGPVGTRETVDAFRAGLRLDVGYRIAHHGADVLPTAGIDCDITELAATPQATPVATIGDLEIEAFEVDHRPVEPALGFRFRRNGRTLVMSGDTGPCQQLVDASRGADMLVSEALNATMWDGMLQMIRNAGNERGARILGDVPNYHSTTIDVAKMASDAGVKQLVLSHLMPTPPNEGPVTDAFTAGMSDVFGGQITVGRDLMRLSIDE
jgi:ribonuclease Z